MKGKRHLKKKVLLFSVVVCLIPVLALASNSAALKKARSYLSYSAFSREGLIGYLKYEGFADSEAVDSPICQPQAVSG